MTFYVHRNCRISSVRGKEGMRAQPRSTTSPAELRSCVKVEPSWAPLTVSVDVMQH